MGDSAFDSAELYGKLFHDFHFSRALIPYNPRNESSLKKLGTMLTVIQPVFAVSCAFLPVFYICLLIFAIRSLTDTTLLISHRNTLYSS